MRFEDFFTNFWRVIKRCSLLLMTALLLGGSGLNVHDVVDQIRLFTRPVEFNYLSWTIEASLEKLSQLSLHPAAYADDDDRVQLVFDYLEMLQSAQRTEQEVQEALGDPGADQTGSVVQEGLKDLESIRNQVNQLRPLAESILQEQVAIVVAGMGLESGGAPFPPVVFTFDPLPNALIVSPRDIIRQVANITLNVDLALERKVNLEQGVEESLNVSALVVPIGGMGTYPTMVQESTTLTWIVEVIGHEWIHNYLSLRPLGLNYFTNAELRTMNETTASLMGKAIGREVIRQYYPALLPPETVSIASSGEAEPPAFDFRKEMHETRIQADALLIAGEIEAAERYMEARRQVFWEHGYRLRRLNQAYFAFHGAYADEPGGAAGVDPVGEAVRALWEYSPAPAEFLRKMAWMNDYAELLAALEGLATIR
ncbi:MAG: hypothetical protein MUP44_09395 [Anaerolineales bacterium]|nr:hypothetical protein [Anaerolineales bacterium]